MMTMTTRNRLHYAKPYKKYQKKYEVTWKPFCDKNSITFCHAAHMGVLRASGSGACLDDSQAKGLLEGDICENAAGGVGEQVDVRNVLLLVLLGVGNAAVQVVRIDQLHHLGQDLLAAWRHAVDVLTVALRATHQPFCLLGSMHS